MFISALFTIGRQRQPKCPSTDELIKKKWCDIQWNITHKKDKIVPSVQWQMDGPPMWMDLECPQSGSKLEREKTTPYIDAYMWNLKKMVPMNLFVS